MDETERLEDEVRNLLRELAGGSPAAPSVPRKMIRRANFRRARTTTVLGVAAVLLGYGMFAGTQALRGVPGPAGQLTVPTPTGLSQSVRLVHVYHVQPELMTAGGGRFYGIAASGSSAGATVLRIDPDGTITRREVADPLASYFSQFINQGQSLYVGTSVIKRFTSASDELLRLNASTLTVTARATLRGGVIGLASDPQGVWVALADRVLRLDPVSLAVRAFYVIPGATPPPVGSSSISSLALGPGGLWATFGDAPHTTLYRFDSASLAVLGRVRVPESGQGIRVVAGSESVWLTGEDFVRRVDPSGHLANPTVVRGLQVAATQGRGLVALLSSGGVQEALLQFDAQGDVVARSEVGDAGGRLGVDGRDVWLLHGLSLAHWTLLNPEP